MNKRQKKKALRKLALFLQKKPTIRMTPSEANWIDRQVTGWKHNIKKLPKLEKGVIRCFSAKSAMTTSRALTSLGPLALVKTVEKWPSALTVGYGLESQLKIGKEGEQ